MLFLYLSIWLFVWQQQWCGVIAGGIGLVEAIKITKYCTDSQPSSPQKEEDHTY